MTILKVPGGMLSRPSTDEDRTQANEIAQRVPFARKPPQTMWQKRAARSSGHRRAPARAGMREAPTKPAIDAMFTMAPPPCRGSCGMSSFTHSHTPGMGPQALAPVNLLLTGPHKKHCNSLESVLSMTTAR